MDDGPKGPIGVLRSKHQGLHPPFALMLEDPYLVWRAIMSTNNAIMPVHNATMPNMAPAMGSNFNMALPDRLKALGDRMSVMESARRAIACNPLIFETHTAPLSGQQYDEPAMREFFHGMTVEQREEMLRTMQEAYINRELAAWESLEPVMGKLAKLRPAKPSKAGIPSLEELDSEAKRVYFAYGESATVECGCGPVVTYDNVYGTLMDNAMALLRNAHNLNVAYWYGRRDGLASQSATFVLWARAMASKVTDKGDILSGLARPSNRAMKRALGDTIRRIKADGDLAPNMAKLTTDDEKSAAAYAVLGAAKNSPKEAPKADPLAPMMCLPPAAPMAELVKDGEAMIGEADVKKGRKPRKAAAKAE